MIRRLALVALIAATGLVNASVNFCNQEGCDGDHGKKEVVERMCDSGECVRPVTPSMYLVTEEEVIDASKIEAAQI